MNNSSIHRLRDDIAHALKGSTTKAYDSKIIQVAKQCDVQFSFPQELKPRDSAILILLYPGETEIFLAITRRAAHMRFMPRALVFPGGNQDEGEDFETTALREAQEEIGVRVLRENLLGSLPFFYRNLGKGRLYRISTQVALLKHTPHFAINPGEVEELIELPVSSWLSEETLKSPFFALNKEMKL